MEIIHYEPARNLVLIEHPNQDKKTESGIVLPEEVVAKQLAEAKNMIFCKVIAVGPEVRTCKSGDSILFSGPSTVLTFEDGGVPKEYLQFGDHQILGRQKF